jgi:hypothetical protein
MSCTLCWNAMPEGEWCRACGEGRSEPPAPVESMTGVRLAVRIAKGGPLSSDGPAEMDAFHAAMCESREETP